MNDPALLAAVVFAVFFVVYGRGMLRPETLRRVRPAHPAVFAAFVLVNFALTVAILVAFCPALVVPLTALAALIAFGNVWWGFYFIRRVREVRAAPPDPPGA